MNWRILFFLFTSYITFSQNFYLSIKSTNETEQKTIDSIAYKIKFNSINELEKENISFVNKIKNLGYFTISNEELIKKSDSTYISNVQLNRKTEKITIDFSKTTIEIKDLLQLSNSITVITSEVETFLNTLTHKLDNLGYSFSEVFLSNFNYKNTTHLNCELNIILNERRTINAIVIKGYEKFPVGYHKYLERKYSKKPFSNTLINSIENQLLKINLAQSTRTPEILFKRDSTKVFLYLSKRKVNSFDGYLGFANNEQQKKIIFNGHIDISLFNNLNSGEKIIVFWKNDGNQQSNFKLASSFNYLLKTSLALKSSLRIFKQDSTFQNSNFDIDLGFLLDSNKKVFIGYNSNNSESISNTNSLTKDYTSKFYTISFEYNLPSITNFISLDKMYVHSKIGIGNRIIEKIDQQQFFGQLNWNYLLELNKKNQVFLKNENFYLISPDYIINELYRFGGVQSIRGFRENSLQANYYSGIMTEYRYIAANNLYLHSVLDYGFAQDKTTTLNNQLFSFGFGVGLLNKSGIFNLIYANGSTNGQTIKLSNSIVQVSYKTIF